MLDFDRTLFNFRNLFYVTHIVRIFMTAALCASLSSHRGSKSCHTPSIYHPYSHRAEPGTSTSSWVKPTKYIFNIVWYYLSWLKLVIFFTKRLYTIKRFIYIICEFQKILAINMRLCSDINKKLVIKGIKFNFYWSICLCSSNMLVFSYWCIK